MKRPRWLVVSVAGLFWIMCGIWIASYLAWEIEWKEWQILPMWCMGIFYFIVGISLAVVGAAKAFDMDM